MNVFPAAVMANAILAIPPAFAGSGVSTFDVLPSTSAVAASGYQQHLRDFTSGSALFGHGYTLFCKASGDANTSTGAYDILVSIRYLPLIRNVLTSDHAEDAIREFLMSANPAALAYLFSALNAPDMEERRWEILELLGEAGTAENLPARLQHLQVALSSANAGDRAAAASAIGSIGHPLACSLLANQLARESNSIVKALLEAKLRVTSRNGSTFKTAA